MKKLLSLLAAFALVLTISGCSKEEKPVDPTDPEKPTTEKVKIGANIYNAGDNFIGGVVKPNLEKFAKEKGADIEIVDSENNQAKLNDQVDTFINKGVDVLVVNLVDPAAAPQIIEKAKNADIPLVLYNKESQNPTTEMAAYDKVWYVGTDSKQSGVIQGDMIAKDIQAHPEWDKNADGVIQYVMLKGEPGHPDAEARTEWSVKQIEAAGIKVEQLELQADKDWSTTFGKNTMDAWLAKYGDKIELVISNNDGMAFGAAEAMKAAGVNIPLYGVDALDQALQMIEEGTMTGTVLNDGVNQAKATIDLAVNVAQGKEPTEGTDWTLTTDGSKAVRVDYVGVTKDNLDQFKK